MSAGVKRTRTTIGTHSGQFHVDEALACWMLKQLPEYKDAEIVRTRNSGVLAELDVLVDVGAEYDAARLRFDHHQRSFVDTFSDAHAIRLSSAGLVYKHFGRRVVAQLAGWAPGQSDLDDSEREKRIDCAWLKIYDSFIKALDAIDNGVSQYDTDQPPRYRSSTDLAARVGRLNPSWYDADAQSPEAADRQFEKAMQLAGDEFTDAVRSFCADWFIARDIVQAACRHSRRDMGDDTQIFVLERPCPWKDHLFEFEAEHGIAGQFKYCLYPDGSNWRIQAVPATLGAFGDRLSLPEPWRGVRDEALSQLLGIPGCIFVHASGFIGGATTKEAVLEMARRALAIAN